MTDATAGGDGQKDGKKKRPSQPITAERFAELAGGMSQVLAKFSSFKGLQDENMGFAEWVVLCELKKGSTAKRRIAKALGADSARVDQIVSALQTAGLVESTKGDDAKGLDLTQKGKDRINAVNAKLTPLFAAAFEGKDRALQGGMKTVGAIVKALGGPGEKEEKAKKREGRSEKKGNVEARAKRKAERKAGKNTKS